MNTLATLTPQLAPATPHVLRPGKRYVIGRGAAADVRVDHPSVSRSHAILEMNDERRWCLYDAGSHNGTRVNGHRVSAHALADGDHIEVGTVFVLFADADDSRAVAVSAPPEHDPSRPPIDDAVKVEIRHFDRHARPSVSGELVAAILDHGRALAEIADADERLRRLLALVIAPEIGGRCAYALRVRERAAAGAKPADVEIDSLAPPAFGAPMGGEEPRLSRSVLRTILRDGEPVLAAGTERVARFEAEMTAMPGPSKFGAIACPIARRDDAGLDVLYVILPAAMANLDWLMLVSLAVEQYRNADAAWAARRAAEQRAAQEHEMELAREIQSRTLPDRESVASIDWATWFEPCLAVAGDYVDVVERDDGRVLLVIADAAGKGVHAALVTAGLHAIVRTAGRATPVESLVDAANRYLRALLPGTSFVTLAAVELHPRTGAGTSVNCGHLPLLAIDAAGVARSIDGGDNLPLGVTDDAIRGEPFTLADGECLIGYTDGLTELRNEFDVMLSMRGFETIAREACRDAGATTQSIVDAIRAAADRFRGAAAVGDDRTLLVARRR